MIIKMDERIAEQFNQVQVGVLVMKGVTNLYGDHAREIDDLLCEQEENIVRDFEGIQVQSKEEIRIWRDVYTQFGAKASKFHSSIESLIRMVLSEKNNHHIRRINPLVDIYNSISLKYRLPVGGDNIDKTDGGIQLTIADGTEPFGVLNTGDVELVKENEVIYRDEREVLCRRWNWRECDKTKLDERTTNLCLFVEGVERYPEENIRKILSELEALIQTYCGGTSQMTVLNKDNLSFEF